jgi:hypothetical protein
VHTISTTLVTVHPTGTGMSNNGGGSGLALSDKIALGVGIGVGLPATLGSLVTCLMQIRHHRR